MIQRFLNAPQIVESVVKAYQNAAGVFANYANAEDYVPTKDKYEVANYLFWVIQMDYQTKSSTLYENATKLWGEDNSRFSAKWIAQANEKTLRKLIEEGFRPRFPNEIFLRFRNNSEALLTQYDGEAYNIIKASSSARELLDKILQFRGFGPKLGNFLLRTYVDLFDLKYNDLEEILPPVDIHDVRLAYQWGLTDSQEMSAKNIQRIKELWSEACKKANVNWIIFDKALWLLGSNGKYTGDHKADFYRNLGVNPEPSL